MKKIFSIFAAMLLASSMMADPVVLPATLDVTNVSFRSEGMPDFVIEEGQDYAGTYFDMGAHDSSNDTLLYAEWDVTIEPINYYIAVDVYNTNSWRVQLHLLNQNGDTLKDLRYKGSSGQCGHYAIGSLDLSDLEAGNYKLRARAATAWSQMKLKDVIFTADYSGVAVNLPGTLLPAYAELSSGASIADDAIAFAPSTANNEYAIWNVSFEAAGSFNVAIDITASNGHNYGVALLSADGQTEIASVNEGGQHGDMGVKELGAIEVPAAGTYTVKLTNATQWSEAVLNSISFAAPAASEYYIKGTMNGWQLDENYKMTLNEAADDVEYMIDMTLAIGDEFKVFEDNGTADGVWHPGADNYVVDADHVGEATVYFRPNGKEGWYYTVIYVAMKEEPQPADEWAKIVWTEAAGKAAIAEDAVYTAPESEFALTLHDEGDKMEIDANDCRFGTAEAYTMYNFRIKSGGASSSTKNFFTLNIPEAGILRIAPRTGSNSATDRALVIAQGETELYNAIVQESQAIKVIEGEGEGAKEVSVYPYVEVAVAAGEVRVSYNAGMNFYAFAFKAGGSTTGITNTEVGEKAVKVFQNGQLIIIKNGVKYNVLGMTL